MIIDIITLSGLTAVDGSIIASGATVKFSSEFHAGSTNFYVKPVVYRSRELLQSGFSSVGAIDVPEFIDMSLTQEEFYALTILNLHDMVRDELNAQYGEYMFEIEITGE